MSANGSINGFKTTFSCPKGAFFKSDSKTGRMCKHAFQNVLSTIDASTQYAVGSGDDPNDEPDRPPYDPGVDFEDTVESGIRYGSDGRCYSRVRS